MGSLLVIRLGLIAAVAAVGAAALVANVVPNRGPKRGTPTIVRDPAPPLFTSAEVAPIERATAEAGRRADAAARKWLDGHPDRDDAAFAAMAAAAVGPPPPHADGELAQLHRLMRARTPAQTNAARWLEVHGKKDLWLLFADQYTQLYGPSRAKGLRHLVKQTYALSKAVAAQAKATYRRRSPYVVDPSLHGINQTPFAGQTHYSYPSKHSVIAAAEVAVLAQREPSRSAELAQWEAQIDYSRLVGGGHYASDVAAGAFLGRLVGDYEAHFAGRAR